MVLVVRPFDVILSGFRIPMAGFIGLILVLIFSGGLGTVMRSRVSMAMLFFFGWLCISTVFSTYRYQSTVYLQTVLYAVIVYAATVVFACTPRSVNTLLKAMGWLALFHGFFSLYAARPDFPRLVYQQGFYGDPNQLGMYLIAGLPFCWYLMKESGYFVKFFVIIGQCVVLWAFLKTSSRGAMLALFICVFVLWLASSLMRKVAIALLCAISIAFFLVAAPPYMKVRFVNIFDSSAGNAADLQQMSESDQEQLGLSSGEARLELLKDSLLIISQNPIVGVGLGNFGGARWQYYKTLTGKNYAAQTNHNTYLQITSEAGIPAMILFLAMVFVGFSESLQVLRYRANDGYRVPEQLRNGIFFVMLAQFTSLVATFFLSQGYFEIILLLGVMVGLKKAVEFDHNRYRLRALAKPAA